MAKVVYTVRIKRVAEISDDFSLEELKDQLTNNPERFLNDAEHSVEDEFDIESEEYAGEYCIENDEGEEIWRIGHTERQLHEVIADLAYNAGAAGWTTGDSRADVSEIQAWAKEFCDRNKLTDWDEVDYIETVDEFFREKLGDEIEKQYLLHICGGVEAIVLGPYNSEEDRDEAAIELYHGNDFDPDTDSIFPLNGNISEIGVYSATFFE